MGIPVSIMGRKNSSTAAGVSDSDLVLRESAFGGSFGGKSRRAANHKASPG
jgi:hypothetical protein